MATSYAPQLVRLLQDVPGCEVRGSGGCRNGRSGIYGTSGEILYAVQDATIAVTIEMLAATDSPPPGHPLQHPDQS